jgi:hypothetical protein
VASSSRTVAGQTLTVTVSILSGVASAINIALGQTFTVSVTIIAGSASGEFVLEWTPVVDENVDVWVPYSSNADVWTPANISASPSFKETA